MRRGAAHLAAAALAVVWTFAGANAGAIADACCGVAIKAGAVQGRRVVDVVTVGSAASERDHEFAAEGDRTGSLGARTYREAAGWQRYVLTIWDDTDVTLVCTFAGTGGVARRFVLEVDGIVVPVKPLMTPDASPVDVEISIPPAITRRHTAMAATFRAAGGPTPGLIQLRTVQEHLEVW